MSFFVLSTAYHKVNGPIKKPKNFIKNAPLIGTSAVKLQRIFRNSLFPGSAQYWEWIYQRGGTSGDGSYGRLAEFKAEIINRFVQVKQVQSVVEFGCGDGNQLSLSRYPSYLGLDVSNRAVLLCKKRFANDPTKTFTVLARETLAAEATPPMGELALSLDVIYHLVEDNVFEDYMRALFAAAQKYVCIYSTNFEKMDRTLGPCIRHRRFTNWVEKFASQWRLIQHTSNRYPEGSDNGVTSNAEFCFYERIE